VGIYSDGNGSAVKNRMILCPTQYPQTIRVTFTDVIYSMLHILSYTHIINNTYVMVRDLTIKSMNMVLKR
jgi:hypothetical protein